MSISAPTKKLQDKETFLGQGRHFKHLFETVKRISGKGSIDFIFTLAVVLTAFGELFSQKLSLKWYILVYALFLLFLMREAGIKNEKN